MAPAESHKNAKPKGRRESWRVPTLIRRALDAKDQDAAWKCVMALQCRGTREVFMAASKLCGSRKALERRLGADILGQLGVPARTFPKETLRILHGMLRTETVPKVLNSVLTAIGHIQEAWDTRGIRRIVALRRHESADVRFGVVMALLGRDDQTSLAALVELTQDRTCHIRDWATFGLGTQTDADTPTVRDALRKRLGDTDTETRCEAIMGLARRKDPVVRGELVKELAQDDPTSLVFEAAAEYGNSDLLKHLKRHLRIAKKTKNVNQYWLTEVKAAVAVLQQMLQE